MVVEEKYFSVTQTAELGRGALKKNFPGIKFSVRSHSYSGGASINVGWVLGPDSKEVDAVCRQYESADFDGMIDLQTYKSHWLLPDGSAIIRNAPGTEGSRGVIAPEHHEAPEGAVPVHFGAHYIQTRRQLAEDWEDEMKLREQVARDMCALNQVEWKGCEETVNLFGEADHEPAHEHALRILAATSFLAGESYGSVRWATEEERLHTNELMVIVKKGVAQVAAATVVNVEGITVRENPGLNGLEMMFPGKPDDSVIAQLKNNGWRWHHRKGLWYNRLTEQNKVFAESLMSRKKE